MILKGVWRKNSACRNFNTYLFTMARIFIHKLRFSPLSPWLIRNVKGLQLLSISQRRALTTLKGDSGRAPSTWHSAWKASFSAEAVTREQQQPLEIILGYTEFWSKGIPCKSTQGGKRGMSRKRAEHTHRGKDVSKQASQSDRCNSDVSVSLRY